MSYISQEKYPNLTINIAGTWAADVVTNGGNVIALDYTPYDWEPKQVCDANNQNCQPFTPESGKMQITATSQDTVTADGLTWTRVQQ